MNRPPSCPLRRRIGCGAGFAPRMLFFLLFVSCVSACPSQKSADPKRRHGAHLEAAGKRPPVLLYVLDTGVGEKQPLRFRFNPGSSRRYLLELAVRHRAWGRTSKISVLAELEEAVQASGPGRARVRLTLPKLLAYRPPVGREGIAHALSEWAVMVEVDESGRVFSVKGSGNARPLAGLWASTAGAGGGVVLPEAPVGLGARWRVVSSLTLPRSQGDEGPLWVEAETSFRLTGVQRRRKKRLAAIEAESRYRVLGGLKAALGHGKGQTRLTLDMDAGELETLRSTVDLSLMVSGTSADSVELTQKMRMEKLAKLKKNR